MSARWQAIGARVPRDIVLEPDERVLIATKPLALWLPATLLLLALWALALWAWGAAADARLGANVPFAILTVVAVAATVFLGMRWLRWRGRTFVLTNRRVIDHWGVFDRNQAAILLDRVQDVTLERPFPLSLLRGYGILQIETAGEHSSERVSGGPGPLAMEHADAFHALLTEALLPDQRR